MTNKDILDLGLASGLIDKRNNGQLIIDFTLLPDPDLYKFARLIEELTIVEAVERIRNLSYVSSSGHDIADQILVSGDYIKSIFKDKL